MNITTLINKFPLDKMDSVLEVFIGKNLNRQLFSINNKIFFDTFYSYLIKNGWSLENQYILKSIYAKEFVLESKINNEISNILDFEIPFSQSNNLYQKKNGLIKKFKGTYYDILCSFYEKEPLDVKSFQQNVDSIYNETIEEINVFTKKSTSCTIQLNIEKISSDQNNYSVKIIFNNPISNKESIDELFEIIDYAMAKYKKTDRTIASVFDNI